MGTKKVYVASDEVTSIEVVYVHKDYPANASGAKEARFDGVDQPIILIQASHDNIHIVDPRIRMRSM